MARPWRGGSCGDPDEEAHQRTCSSRFQTSFKPSWGRFKPAWSIFPFIERLCVDFNLDWQLYNVMYCSSTIWNCIIVGSPTGNWDTSQVSESGVKNRELIFEVCFNHIIFCIIIIIIMTGILLVHSCAQCAILAEKSAHHAFIMISHISLQFSHAISYVISIQQKLMLHNVTQCYYSDLDSSSEIRRNNAVLALVRKIGVSSN